MNEKFEQEMNLLILEVSKLFKKISIFGLVVAIGIIGLYFIDYFSIFMVIALLLMIFTTFTMNSLKKRYTKMLQTYQSDRETVLKQLEVFAVQPQSKRKNIMQEYAKNAYLALKEQQL